jgi:hypothetical protein
MSESFTESVEESVKAASKPVTRGAGFDSESKEYNEVIGRLLKKKYPLIIPKPPIPDDPSKGITVEQDTYAHEAWVWHPEDKEKGLKAEWAKHQASFDQDTDMLLKGAGHKTFQMTLDGEKSAGNEIVKRDNGYYYRQPIKK